MLSAVPAPGPGPTLLEVKEKDGVRSRLDGTTEVLTGSPLGGGPKGSEEVGMSVALAPSPPSLSRPPAESPFSLAALLLLTPSSSSLLGWSSLEALC